jgi:hypothetical protein
MDRRRSLGRRLQPCLVDRRQLGRIERAEPLEQHPRTGEGLLHRDLLVEREADEQRHRLGDEQAVGLVVAGEVESIGRHARIVARTMPFSREVARDRQRGRSDARE